MNWLFNSTQNSDDLSDYPRGPAVGAELRPAGGFGPAGFEPAIWSTWRRPCAKRLIFFEPRLMPHTVRVFAEPRAKSSHNVISFRMEAQLWAQPIPLEIFMRTDMDLESGQTRVVESSGR